MCGETIADELTATVNLSRAELLKRWETAYSRSPPKGISRRHLEYSAAYHIQAKAFGGLKPSAHRKLRGTSAKVKVSKTVSISRKSTSLTPGTRLVREWHGKTYTIEVQEQGYCYNGETYLSLSKIARTITGTRWSGPRFFGL